MIRVDVVQGSAEWLAAKVAIPSASNFHRILTPRTLKPSSAMAGYCHELLAEKVLGRPLDDATTQFMQRGTLEEKAARAWYGLQRDVDVEEVGFLLRDDGRVGCSPDGLVGNDGGLEIKVPEASTHIGYMLGEVSDKYLCQIQGGMWIAERSWWDFVSYNEKLPSTIVRFERDEKFITALESAVNNFLEYMLDSQLKLQKLGLFQGERIPDLRVA